MREGKHFDDFKDCQMRRVSVCVCVCMNLMCYTFLCSCMFVCNENFVKLWGGLDIDI